MTKQLVDLSKDELEKLWDCFQMFGQYMAMVHGPAETYNPIETSKLRVKVTAQLSLLGLNLNPFLPVNDIGDLSNIPNPYAKPSDKPSNGGGTKVKSQPVNPPTKPSGGNALSLDEMFQDGMVTGGAKFEF